MRRALRLWSFTRGHRALIVGGLALSILDALCQAAVPLFFRDVLNLIQVDADLFIREHLWPTVALAGIVCLVFFPSAFVHHVMVSFGLARLANRIRTRLYDHIQRLSSDFFQRHRVGEITARLNTDLEAVVVSFRHFNGVFWGAVFLVISSIFMFIVRPELAGIVLALLALVFVLTWRYLPKIQRMTRAVRDATGAVSGTITEYVGIQDLIRSFAREESAQSRVEQDSLEVQKRTEDLTWKQFLFTDIMQLLLRFIIPMGLLFFGAWLVRIGYMLAGDLVMFWGYWMLLNGTVRMIFENATQIFGGMAAADRILDFLDETPTVRDGDEGLTRVRGAIDFRGVVFNYPAETDKRVLDAVDLTVSPGETVAVVGPSGAGKSTIIQLILRFYDPLEGTVRLDGQDLRTLRQADLRSNIGIVMQESVFFSGTIEENLRLGRPDATRDEMVMALRHADALEFVESFPAGIRTVLGERGLKLSGGQKQRLAIARVFLKDPPVILFDEATSSLDSVAEKAVQETMERLMKGRTTIIVAHRISTILSADRIFILEDGRIRDSGSHTSLLKRDPLYQELCIKQGIRVV